MIKSTEFYYLAKLRRAIELVRFAQQNGDLKRNGELIETLLEMVNVYLARKFTAEYESTHESS